VEAALAKAPRPGYGPTGASDLHAEVRRDLERLRGCFYLPQYCRRPAYPSARQVYECILTAQDNACRDPVLRLALASHEQLTSAVGRLWVAAMEAYLKAPDAYDAVLGDLFPSQFRAAARAELAQRAYAGGANETAAADWAAYGARAEARRRQPLPGLSTGLAGLDAATGGLRGIMFLGAPPNAGKSALAEAAALAALGAHPELAVLFYSLDMGKTVVYDRLLCHETGLAYAALHGPAPSAKATGARERAEEQLLAGVLKRLRVVERPARPFTPDMLLRDRWRLLKATGATRALVVIDYFQLIDVGARDGSPLEADHQRLSVLQEAQKVSRSPDRPDGDAYLVLSEVRKGESGRSGLAVADLLGSARLGYRADAVLLLEPAGGADADGDTTPLALTVAKGRDGMTRTQLRLEFDFKCLRFREVEPRRKNARPTRSGPGGGERSGRPAAPDIDPLAGGKEGAP
jgi:hypothetical protein